MSYLDPKTGYMKSEKYIKTIDVNESSDNIEVAVLLLLAKRAKENKKEEQVITYLETALSEFPNSTFIEIVENQLLENKGSIETSDNKKLVAFSAKGAVTYNNVNLRSEPNTSSDILTSLNKGLGFSVSKKTDYEEEIDGFKSSWYFILLDDGTKGWIYGAFTELE